MIVPGRSMPVLEAIKGGMGAKEAWDAYGIM